MVARAAHGIQASRSRNSTGTTGDGTSTSTGSTTTIGGTPRIACLSETVLFLLLTRGSFLFQIFFPADKHFACLNQGLRHASVLFVVEHAAFPTNLQEKFRQIQFCDCCYHCRGFLRRWQVACAKRPLQRFKKQRIDFQTQCLSAIFWCMREENVPQQIGLFDSLQNGQQSPAGGGPLEESFHS